MNFSEPSNTDGTFLPARNLQNHLLIVWPIQYYPHVQTQYTQAGKPSDAIIVDVVDVSGGPCPPDRQTGQSVPAIEPGTLGRRCQWMQSQLIRALRPRVGQGPLLGTIGLGLSKGGNTPPFVFNSLTSDPAAVERAQAWLDANTDFVPSEQEDAPEPPMAQQQAPYPSQQAYQGWPQGSVPAQQYGQGNFNAPQQPQQFMQQAPPQPQWGGQQPQQWAPSQPQAQVPMQQQGQPTVLDRLRQQHQNNPTLDRLTNAQGQPQMGEPPF